MDCTAKCPTVSASCSVVSICHSSCTLATNRASILAWINFLFNIINACFITIAPAPCSKVFSAACCDRTINLRPSNPGNHSFSANRLTLSLSFCKAGVFFKKLLINRLPSRSRPPTIAPILAGPAP